MSPITTQTESKDRRPFGPGFFRYGLPGLFLGVLLTVLLFGVGRLPKVQAQVQSGGLPASASGLLSLTVPMEGDPGGTRLVLIDTRTRAMALYKIDGFKGSLKLEAARQFGADLKLSEYNNLPPEVASIEAMVSRPRAAGPSR